MLKICKIRQNIEIGCRNIQISRHRVGNVGEKIKGNALDDESKS